MTLRAATLLILSCCSCALAPAAAVTSQAPVNGVEAAVREIERLAERPSGGFLEAALAANRLARPDLDAEEIAQKILKMSQRVRKSAGKNPSREKQIEALNKVLYEREKFETPEGPPPMMEGRALEYYALPDVLSRRQAYCEGLALVYVLVGREAGFPVAIQRSPAHVFCRFDLQDRSVNIECTDGGRETTDEELVRESRAKPAAKFSAVYFRDLTANGILALQLNSVAYNLITHPKRKNELSPDQWRRVAAVLVRLQPDDPETLNTAAMIYLLNDDRYTARMLHQRCLWQVSLYGAPEALRFEMK